MKNLFLLALILLTANPALARVEESYRPDKIADLTLIYNRVTPASRAADMEFVKGMTPHHAGALTMSEEYLNNPGASSPTLKKLARGIIHNQKFEIGMLAAIHTLAEKPLAEIGEYRAVAVQGLAQNQKFIFAPMPDSFGLRGENISAADVAFAKGMIVHHQGAVDMAHDYLNNPNATNNYLRLMCNDIITDQSQEIALMEAVISAYPGDAAAVKPAKVHGMDHMGHGKDNKTRDCGHTKPDSHKH
ncbi:MAG TPA: DUF305 domain-containing protein [Alphaproteobacteria bacterium]|nr:DUF305 domain-containing protein [Rhodospirillaceae bacterium]HRJ12784.1 DUF305 domain-containing protein [Alphaproteobacteria bacterium]